MRYTITEAQRLQALGLLTLIEQANRDLARLTGALAEILGQPGEPGGYYGHVSDIAIEVGDTVAPLAALGRLIEMLAIEVTPQEGR